MSSIESHLSNKPKQVFFNPKNIFDTFTHSIALLYIFNKLFSFNVNFLIYRYRVIVEHAKKAAEAEDMIDRGKLSANISSDALLHMEIKRAIEKLKNKIREEERKQQRGKAKNSLFFFFQISST